MYAGVEINNRLMWLKGNLDLLSDIPSKVGIFKVLISRCRKDVECFSVSLSDLCTKALYLYLLIILR